MGPISSVRPSVQTLGTSPQPSAGTYQGGTSARNGATAEMAAQPDSSRPVAPSAAAARGDLPGRQDLPDPGYVVEAAKARAEAAQRAYMVAQMVAGLNPLNDHLR